MIVYNSHEASSLLRITGSVLPAALKWASIAGIGAFILKYIENNFMPEGALGNLEISAAAFSGFSFTLGFVVVFRTSQCYQRFWHCTVHVNHMRAEWYEAASCLTTFIVTSPKPLEEQDMFSHKVIRYFSLLHALALQSLVDGTEAFPAIDIESLPDEYLKHISEAGCDADGMTASVELVYQWIQALIVHSMSQGLLNVPPPILTRVLQMLSSGMVNYRSVLDIISIPFPFPYAQVTFILLTFYVSFVPLVMCLLVKEAWIACVCGFLSVLCLITVDLVSTEIENPFGQDPNDLPCLEFQHKMNNSLIALMHPAAADPPELGPNAKLSFQELIDAQASLAIVNIDTPKFHGGKLKTRKPPAESKPSPVVKPREPRPPDGDSTLVTVVSAVQPATQASVAQQELLTQQATMLDNFVQSNGAVLERMDRTINTITVALTQQLSSISELQARQTMQSQLERPDMIADQVNTSGIEATNRSVGRNLEPSAENPGTEVAPCFSFSSALTFPCTRSGLPPGAATDPPASAPKLPVAPPRRS